LEQQLLQTNAEQGPQVGARGLHELRLRAGRVHQELRDWSGVARVGRRIDESSPMVDARLPDGSRVNAIVHPLAVVGSALTIRKFAADPYMVEDLIAFDTLTREVADFLDACVRGKANILVAGGTGAGGQCADSENAGAADFADSFTEVA
jgi:hypothetical protein